MVFSRHFYSDVYRLLNYQDHLLLYLESSNKTTDKLKHSKTRWWRGAYSCSPETLKIHQNDICLQKSRNSSKAWEGKLKPLPLKHLHAAEQYWSSACVSARDPNQFIRTRMIVVNCRKVVYIVKSKENHCTVLLKTTITNTACNVVCKSVWKSPVHDCI